jgi:hypothetical protein
MSLSRERKNREQRAERRESSLSRERALEREKIERDLERVLERETERYLVAGVSLSL